MSGHAIKSWSTPGALLDALIATRKAVDAVSTPIPTSDDPPTDQIKGKILDQLDHHLIPRVRSEAAPATVVVAGSTGAGKSTVVNALLGEQLTPAGVLRPTTQVPHAFHNPRDIELLDDIVATGRVRGSESVPRGLVIVDSPDLDSVRAENREIARLLLEAADLWVFVTTAARYGDALPWAALKEGAERGASIAIVLNRVEPDVAATVRRNLVERLKEEGLDDLPLFVVPEDADAEGRLPRDVVGGIARWLESIASASAATIVERTMHGAHESLKEWLETLAERIDDQGALARDMRGEVRRVAASMTRRTDESWIAKIPTGVLIAGWDRASTAPGPLSRLSASLWSRRRSAREKREAVLEELRREAVAATEAAVALTATSTRNRIDGALIKGDRLAGTWLVDKADADQAAVSREHRAGNVARQWIDAVTEIAETLPQYGTAVRIVGVNGVTVYLMCAALGISHARVGLGLMTTPSLGPHIEKARDALLELVHAAIKEESLAAVRPADIPALMPDVASAVRIRRAELRGLT